MAGPGEGGPARLAILLGSLAGLLLIAVHTIGGSASAGHRPATARKPGKIVAVAARRRLPLSVRRQLAVAPAPGPASARTSRATYLLGGTRRGMQGHRVPVASVLRRVGGGGPIRVAKLPVAVTGAAGAAVGDRIYALGGRLAGGVPSNLIQEYDVATERAVIAGRLPRPVTDAAALTLDGFVYLLGGRANGSPARQIVRFDAMRGTAVLAGRPPVPASGGRAAAARSRRGYLVGAAVPGAGQLNFVISLRPPWTNRHRAASG
jgi:hypothetical protein